MTGRSTQVVGEKSGSCKFCGPYHQLEVGSSQLLAAWRQELNVASKKTNRPEKCRKVNRFAGVPQRHDVSCACLNCAANYQNEVHRKVLISESVNITVQHCRPLAYRANGTSHIWSRRYTTDLPIKINGLSAVQAWNQQISLFRHFWRRSWMVTLLSPIIRHDSGKPAGISKGQSTAYTWFHKVEGKASGGHFKKILRLVLHSV